MVLGTRTLKNKISVVLQVYYYVIMLLHVQCCCAVDTLHASHLQISSSGTPRVAGWSLDLLH